LVVRKDEAALFLFDHTRTKPCLAPDHSTLARDMSLVPRLILRSLGVGLEELASELCVSLPSPLIIFLIFLIFSHPKIKLS
jgi:hypothetical protein